MHILYTTGFFTVVCQSLSDPANGQVSSQEAATQYGSVVSYSCSTGFSLQGNAERMCLANGDWSGNEPTCNKGIIYYASTRMCVIPYFVINASSIN